jgi:TonB family protein
MMFTLIAEATVRNSALIVAVWMLLKACRVRDPGAEKLTWTWVLAASLAMPVLTWLAAASALPLQMVSGRMATSMVRLTELSRAPHALSAVVLTVYCLGVATFAIRLAVGLLVGARLRRAAQPALTDMSDIHVRVSPGVRGPVSFGATVLLPACSAGWDAPTLRAVLAHEREHIRNHDGYRLWLAALCRAFFWFNPLVHIVYRRLTVLTELTSDAAAVSAIGDRSTYVNVLLQVATGTSFAQAAVPMAARSTLHVRIRALLGGGERPVTLPRSGKLLLGAGVALLFAVVSACAAPLVMAKVAHAPDLMDYYPVDARHNHQQGRGVAGICIDTHGEVVSARVTSSTGNPMLDSAMIRLAKAYRFQPGTRAGRAVTVCTGLPIKFVLARSRPDGSSGAAAGKSTS